MSLKDWRAVFHGLNHEEEYFEADQNDAGLEQYFAMVRLEAGKVAGGR